MVGRLPILLKDTLQCDNESGSQYRPAAFSCGLPTVLGHLCVFVLLLYNVCTIINPHSAQYNDSFTPCCSARNKLTADETAFTSAVPKSA